MAFLPTPEELSTFATVGDVAGWLEIEGDLLDALTKAVGAKTLTLRTWARIPASRWESVRQTMLIDDPVEPEGTRGLTPIEEGQIGELQSILATLAAGPSPAISGGGGVAQGGRGGGEGHTAGGVGAAEAAGAGSSGGLPGGVDAPPPARVGGELAPAIAGRKGTGPVHDARFGPAGTEACVRGPEEVLQRTASQSGSRWLRVLGDTEEHITPQRLNHGLAHTWWWRAYVVGGLGRDV